MEKNLIFSLGSEEFGIQVLHIKEIIPMQEITSVPNTPAHVKGVINLRGQVIPVVDLSLKFDFKPRAYTDRTCIVVVRNQNPAKERPRNTPDALRARTLDIASGDIEFAPDFGDGAPMPYLLGMARVSGKVKLLQHPIHALLKLAGDA